MSDAKNVLKATDQNFKSEILDTTGLSVVDFWAEWCGPCRQLGPTIEALASEYAGKIKVYKMNVDENPGIPQQYSIRGIPTVIFFKDGKPVEQLVGNQPKQAIATTIDRHLA